MTKTLTFTLEQKAKNTGGDKFVCKDYVNFTVYFPQKTSRSETGECFQTLKMYFDIKTNNVFTFELDKKAKKDGGDKFICKDNDKFSIYFPQSLSRTDTGDCFKSLQISIAV